MTVMPHFIGSSVDGAKERACYSLLYAPQRQLGEFFYAEMAVRYIF